LPDSPVTVDELADADVVVVTHAGYDHRAQSIDVTLAGNAVLVCGTALYGAAMDAGVPAERCAGIVSRGHIPARRPHPQITRCPAHL